jgi:hypothetical protein
MFQHYQQPKAIPLRGIILHAYEKIGLTESERGATLICLIKRLHECNER